MELLRKEGASCMEGFIARAGILKLHSSKITFEFRDKETFDKLTLPLSEVDKVDFFRTLSIIPNGLTLFLKSGEMTHFVVDDRKSWQEAIMRAKRTQAV